MNKKRGFLALGILTMLIIGSFSLSATAENDDKGDFEAPHVSNQIIISFTPDTTPAGIENFYDRFFEEYEISEVERFDSSKDDPGDRLVSISHPATKGILQKLANDPRVELAEYNYIMTIDAEPNDPRFDDYLWGLDNTGQTGGMADDDIDAPEAWDVTTGSSDIIIGVIDTGVDYTHEDLAGNMWINLAEANGVTGVDDDGNGYVDDIHGWNAISNDGDPMDDNGHGTHVAGTIGAKGDNGIGVVGVNWNVSIAACKFLSASGSGSTFDAMECFNYFNALRAAGYNVLITNNSWGGGGFSTQLQSYMAAFPGLHVAAAGNSELNNDIFPHYPSSYTLDNIISVASTDHNDVLSDHPTWGSNWGAISVDIAAPGSSIHSTYRGDYATGSGTSMASPHVAGAAGLIWSVDQTLSASQVKQLILSNGDPISSVKPTFTNDRLNVFKSLPSTTPIPNDPPTADAGLDQTTGINEGDLVNLSGSGSDPEGQPITYSWTQAGTDTVPVSLTGANTATPSFTAPESTANYDVNLTLTVLDGTNNAQDSVLITVAADNDPPIVPITITGISPGSVQKGLSVNVIISGAGFENGASVTLSNGAGPTPTVSVDPNTDGTTINASITTTNGGPPRDRSWDVTVTNADSSSSTLDDGFMVTINPTNTLPTITINDVAIAEGDSGSTNLIFTVTRSGDDTDAISVDYVTADGTANTPDDYLSKSGTLDFASGISSKEIQVTVNGDTDSEPDQTFYVDLSTCSGCTISDTQGVGTITNDDGSVLPTISINDVSIVEGDSGSSDLIFTVTRSGDTSGDIFANLVTGGGDATAGSDYIALLPDAFLVIFAGDTFVEIPVSINGDTESESDETFSVMLSNCVGCIISDSEGVGTITDDDGEVVVDITFAQYNPNRDTLRVKATSTDADATLTAFTGDSISGPWTQVVDKEGVLKNKGGGSYDERFSGVTISPDCIKVEASPESSDAICFQ